MDKIVDVRTVKTNKITLLALISNEIKLSRAIVKSQNVQKNIVNVFLTIKLVEKLATALNAKIAEQDHILNLK